jgi:two-component system phosphate regulon response regulator PhoB
MARLLVCEDERDLAGALRWHLEREGHRVVVTGDARSALEAALLAPPELVILDWNLPDRPGTAVLQALRAQATTRDVPVLMLTARDAEIDRVVGLELGAEDYVVKPVSLRELTLRVAALLRRAGQTPPETPFAAFGLVVDPKSECLATLDGKPVVFTWQTEAILRTLARTPDLPVPRDRLLRALHGVETDVGARTIDQWVMKLREQLGHAAQAVETVRGVGYRLTGRPASPCPDSVTTSARNR